MRYRWEEKPKGQPDTLKGFNSERRQLALDLLMSDGLYPNRPDVEQCMPSDYRLSEAQRGIVMRIGEAGGGPVVYRDVLISLGIPALGLVHTQDRRPLERFGILYYGNKKVMLTDWGLELYRELVSSSK